MTDKVKFLDLIKRISLADKSAFSEFYDLTSGRVYSMALFCMGDNKESAERVVIDVYIAIWNMNFKYKDGLIPPATWLAAVTWRCSDNTKCLILNQ